VKKLNKLLLLSLVFLAHTSFGQNDSSTTKLVKKPLSPWAHSGEISFNGTNLRHDPNVDPASNFFRFSDEINYKLDYRKNHLKQAHYLDQSITFGRDIHNKYYANNDNLKYSYDLYIDHLKKSNYGFSMHLTTQIPPPTSGDTSRLEISDFFSLAYINQGLTYGYEIIDHIKVTYSPLSGKHSFLLDTSINPKIYGINQNKSTKHEIGTFLWLSIHNIKISEKVTFDAEALFFSNYLENFGKIDINYTSTLSIKLTKWFSVAHKLILQHDNDHIIFEQGLPSGAMVPSEAPLEKGKVYYKQSFVDLNLTFGSGNIFNARIILINKGATSLRSSAGITLGLSYQIN